MAQSAAALKAQQAHELLAAIEAIEEIHRQEFVPASRPIAPDATVTTIDELRAAYEREAMKGVGLFARSSRKQARATALAQAQQYHAWLVEQAEQSRAGTQAELDEMWRRLLANDQEVVIGTLAEAFEDNDAAAAPVGVHDGAAAIVVLVPTVDVVPERAPTLTAAGNLSLKKMTKGERVGLYNLLAFGHLIVTAREAFAVAPGLRVCRLVALRNDGSDVYGKQRASCIFAVRFDRPAFDGIRWPDVRADEVVQQVGREIVANVKGAAKELMPIDLSAEPDLRAVVNALSLDELGLDDTRCAAVVRLMSPRPSSTKWSRWYLARDRIGQPMLAMRAPIWAPNSCPLMPVMPNSVPAMHSSSARFLRLPTWPHHWQCGVHGISAARAVPCPTG